MQPILRPRWLAFLVLAPMFIAPVSRADLVQTADKTYQTEVVRVTADAVVIKTEYGEIPLPRNQITAVQIEEPPLYAASVDVLQAGNYPQAIAGFKSLAERYGGLELKWVENSVLKLADAYLGAGEFLSAKRTYDAFKQMYQGSSALAGMEIKYTRILVAQKKYGQASVSLTAFVEPLLSKKSITQHEEEALSEALLLLGICQQAEGNANDALDSYLAVVALFDVDPELTADARYKAGRIFEQQNKLDRARETYEELLNSARAEQAKQRLAALGKAQP